MTLSRKGAPDVYRPQPRRAPPMIVADAGMPSIALGMFIAQELEAWGFGINSGDGCLVVRALGREFTVTVEERDA